MRNRACRVHAVSGARRAQEGDRRTTEEAGRVRTPKKILVSIGREACGRCQRFYELVKRGEVKIDTNAYVFVRLDIDEYTQRDYFMDAFDPPDGQLPFVGVTDADRSKQRPCLTGYRTAKEYQALMKK